jgi:prephenate dehydrogenase
MSFGTVAILGPGLIGGSLALALAERGLADRLVIYARSEKSFPEIRKKIPQAHFTTNAMEAVREADVVVLCVPIETMAELVKEFAGALKRNALVTDVGSVKASVHQKLAPLLEGKALWIGSHPMAGSEKTGFAAARADLFIGAKIILTPTGKGPDEKRALELAETFWQKLGGNTFKIPPDVHDLSVAHISHLPHLVAALLVNSTREDFFRAAGSGFRDTTRIASGSPELWTQILLDNREKIVEALSEFQANLEPMIEMLQKGDESRLREALQLAHDQRAKLLQEKS